MLVCVVDCCVPSENNGTTTLDIEMLLSNEQD